MGDKDVFGAVVAVDEGELAEAGVEDELFEEAVRLRDLAGGVAVVGFDSQGFEEGAVGEALAELDAALVAAAVDRGEEAGELLDVVGDDVAGEEEGFPVVVWLGDGLHGEQVVGGVLEDQRGDGAGRGEVGEVLEGEGFALDAAGVAEPVGGDAEFGEGLLDDPGFAGGAGDEDGAVGDAAGEYLDARGFVGGDAAGGAQVGDKRVGLFDVEVGHGGNVKT